jgi:hypothetical protein
LSSCLSYKHYTGDNGQKSSKGFAMAIDQHYIPAFSIEDVLLDKDTGAPLSGGIVTFERDSQRGTFKSVYQITGTSPNYTFIALPNPMTLSSIGTFEDAMGNPVVPYFLPYDANFMPDYYFVKVESSGLVPQFTREAVPFIPDAGGTDGATGSLENEVSNPQFAEVFFTTPGPYVFTIGTVSSQVINLGPDWDLIVSCPTSGTVTVKQITPTGALNIAGNPGTILNINSAGLSSLHLRQRIYGSPNLWGSGILASTFLAKTYAGGSSLLKLWYQQSGQSPITINSATLVGSAGYQSFPTSTSIAASASAEMFPDSYIDLYFDIPLSTEIDISNVMVTPTGSTVVSNLQYSQESQNRQIDHLFHYYKPLLEYKPIPSYLVGWDFPLGYAIAAQTIGAVNKSYYAWDQTILFQSVDTAITVSRAVQTNYLRLLAALDTKMAVIQYLSGSEAKKILVQCALGGVSVNVSMISTVAQTMTVSLWWNASPIGTGMASNNSLVSALDANGYPTVTAGWTEITRDSLGKSEFDSLTGQAFLSQGFSNFYDATAYQTGVSFAIVVGCSTVVAGDAIAFESISLVPGKIPTMPAPQTADQVLQECQKYYESSYNSAVVPGSNPTSGYPLFIMPTVQIPTGPATKVGAGPFQINYNTIKATNSPAITFYNGFSGTADNVFVDLYYNGTSVGAVAVSLSTNWNLFLQGEKFTSYVPKTGTFFQTTAAVFAMSSGYMSCQYTIDARLGLIA